MGVGSGMIASLAIGMLAAVAVGQEAPRSKAALYTASDFPTLARGVDPGFSGEAVVSVWGPSTDAWKLRPGSDGVILLERRDRPGSQEPGWGEIGTVRLASRQPLRIVVAAPEEPAEAKKAKKAKKKRTAVPVPAFLSIAERSGPAHPAVTLDIVRGRIDSAAPTADRRRVEVRTNQQGANFQAPATAEAWRDRAEHLREQMLVTLGLWPMFPRGPLHPQVYGKMKREGYTIEKVVLETFPGFTLSGNLYRPEKVDGKVPGILCPHGHWEDGRINPEVQQRCIRWAKLGCVVFLYDMVGYNDSKPFTHAFLNDRLRHWGLSLPTLQTWNSIRALDWLTGLPDVDVARIGCTGESGGGTQTFLLTALDQRVKVAAPVVMVSDSFQGGCVCENAAGLRIGTDNVEFAALCAPRPMFMVGAKGDWTKLTMERAYPAIRGVYSLVGTTDRVGAQVFDFPHNYNQTSRNAVYAAMGRWLLGIDDPDRTREPKDQRPEPGKDLLTFGPDHPAPSGRKTPEELEAFLVDTRRRQVEDLGPWGGTARWEAGRRLLRTALKVRTGIVNPPPDSLDAREVRRLPREEVTIVHGLLGRSGTGEAIPVVRIIPAHPSGQLTVVAHSRGKAGLVDGLGEPSALVRSLLARGQEVVGFDPLFVGESIDPRDPVAHRPETVHFECYNPSLPADRMQDLASVLAWCRAQEDVREVSLIALGEAGCQALVARPLLAGLARTAIEISGLSSRNADPRPAAIDLPGLEQFGGLKAAAALAAPAPLWVFRINSGFDPTWARTAYELAGASPMLRLGDRQPDPDADALARWLDGGE